MAGVEVRKKYRVRIYNCARGPSPWNASTKTAPIFTKNRCLLRRRNTPLSAGGTAAFCWARPSPWPPAFFVESRAAVLRPRVIVAYDREAFVNDVGTVRITFDKDITAMDPGQDLFDPRAAGYHVLPPGQMILEVKFTGILPEYIQTIFHAYSFVRTSASKFCLCADRVRQVLR